jgi:heat shock protein HslJ
MVMFRLVTGIVGLAAIAITATMPTRLAAEAAFPFDKEFLLDAKPMKGSKRTPILTIGPGGDATIDLWCNTVEGQIVVAANTLKFSAVAKTEKQCDAARMKGDEDLLAALAQVSSWRRDGQVLTLSGGKTLRFRPATN